MYLSRHVWLLAGLIPSLALVQTANPDIWEVHESCKADEPHAQESMDTALEMARAAKESLEFLAGPPPSGSDGPNGRLRHNTVYKTVDAVFGLNPKTEGTRLNLRNFDHKAMLLCTDKPGENSWKWYGLEDTIPGMDHKMNQHQDFREMGILNEVKGAWVYEHRLAWKETEKGEPVLLVNSMLAAVYPDNDMVIFGDKLLADPWRSNPSPKALKSSGISAGDAIRKHSSHLSVVMVHELAHWFGGRDNYGHLNIADHTAVTKTDKLLFDNNGITEEHKTPPKGDNYHRLKTYGREAIWNLARPHRTYPDNSGPAKAITNVDSYSIFALMMYLDKWDWSSGGNAKFPGTKRKNPPAP